MKGRVEHTIPFGPLTEYYIRMLYLTQPYTAFSKPVKELTQRLDIPKWVLHDLRRTWATNAPRLQIPPHITERFLAHSNPEGKIAAIYNRYMYTEPMREAIKAQENHIADLVTPLL
jgi:integrase